MYPATGDISRNCVLWPRVRGSLYWTSALTRALLLSRRYPPNRISALFQVDISPPALARTPVLVPSMAVFRFLPPGDIHKIGFMSSFRWISLPAMSFPAPTGPLPSTCRSKNSPF